MFPYPSGELHIGHIRNYVIADAIARFKKQQNYDTFFPMGWDSFGLPAENAAIAHGISPQSWTDQNIDRMKSQMKATHLDIDWDSEIKTSDPNYYRWTQMIFAEMVKRGIAYQAEATVNYDPIEQTVLANEQVDNNGYGKRSGAKIEYRQMKQWFINISQYAPAMIDDIEQSGQPDQVKAMQKHWLENIRDWCVSRQRYWGTPIPVVYCDHCGPQPIDGTVQFPKCPEHDWENYNEIINGWADHGKCPCCGSTAKRATETLDTFFDSSFYFYRYIDVNNDHAIASNEKLRDWFPMDVYIGGIEHSTAHLVFARFMARFLREIGCAIPKEPFGKLICQGMVLGQDSQGNWSKMSKSKGNSAIAPMKLFEQYGVAAVRAFILFKAPIDQDIKWDISDIKGIKRFINKVANIEVSGRTDIDKNLEIEIKDYYQKWKTEMDNYRFNTAISTVMKFYKIIQSAPKSRSRDRGIRIIRRMMIPFIGKF